MTPAEVLRSRFGARTISPRSIAGDRGLRAVNPSIVLTLLAAVEGGALIIGYALVVAPQFAYQGFSYERPTTGVLVPAVAISLLPALVLPPNGTRPSRVILWLLYAFVVIPAAVIPHLIPIGTAAANFVWELLVVGSFALLSAWTRVPVRPWSGLPFMRRHGSVILVALYIGLLGIFISRLGVNVRPLSLEDVYQVRLRARDALASSVLLAYTLPWFQNVVCPMLVASGWHGRRWSFVILGLIGEVWVYQALGNRQALFAVIVLFAILGIGSRISAQHLPLALLSGAVLSLVGVLLFDLVVGGVLLTSIVALRIFMIPGVLSSNYFDFFSSNPIVLLRDGILRFVSASPYALPVANLISDVYYHDPESTSNAHVWADAYANFGAYGFLVVPIVLGALLWVVDASTLEVPVTIVVGAMIFGVVAWSNVGITTSLLTSGVGLMLVLLVSSGGRILVPPRPRRAPAAARVTSGGATPRSPLSARRPAS